MADKTAYWNLRNKVLAKPKPINERDVDLNFTKEAGGSGRLDPRLFPGKTKPKAASPDYKIGDDVELKTALRDAVTGRFKK